MKTQQRNELLTKMAKITLPCLCCCVFIVVILIMYLLISYFVYIITLGAN